MKAFAWVTARPGWEERVALEVAPRSMALRRERGDAQLIKVERVKLWTPDGEVEVRESDPPATHYYPMPMGLNQDYWDALRAIEDHAQAVSGFVSLGKIDRVHSSADTARQIKDLRREKLPAYWGDVI